jgi:hypothetical protein
MKRLLIPAALLLSVGVTAYGAARSMPAMRPAESTASRVKKEYCSEHPERACCRQRLECSHCEKDER